MERRSLFIRELFISKINKAKINSVFMTHIDSHQKENEMRAISREADSIVCMSENHADLISTMGFKGNIIGINLPNRGGNVKEIELEYFLIITMMEENENGLLNIYQN